MKIYRFIVPNSLVWNNSCKFIFRIFNEVRKKNENKTNKNGQTLTQPKCRVVGITNLNKVQDLCPKAYFPLFSKH